jgi:hypothetical protein
MVARRRETLRGRTNTIAGTSVRLQGEEVYIGRGGDGV